MEPPFIAIFSSRLASRLIGQKKFVQALEEGCSILETVMAVKKRQRSDSCRMYWRTPILNSCKIDDDDDDIFFLDVTFDFVASSDEEWQKKLQNCDASTHHSRDVTTSTPRVDVRFGILVRSHSVPNTFGDDNKGGSDNSGCAYSKGCGSFYVQTDVFTKDSLEKYAGELCVDLYDTGPIGMADLMANALQSPHSRTLRVHKLQERGVLSITVGFFHSDLAEEGKILFCEKRPISELLGGYSGESSLQMMLFNIDKNKNITEPDLGKKENIDNIHENNAMKLFHSWWKETNEKQCSTSNDTERDIKKSEGNKSEADSSVRYSRNLDKVLSSEPKRYGIKSVNTKRLLKKSSASTTVDTKISFKKKRKKGKISIGKMI